MRDIIKNEIIIKQDEYLDYINQHIKNVYKAFEIYDEVIRTVLEYDSYDLCRRVINHDASKYSSEEFNAYRRKFYPTSTEINKDKIEEEFDLAWKHHYKLNDHHPEHWILNGVPTDMSDISIAEMILDWTAMSYNFGGTVYGYFSTKFNKNKLTERTNAKVVKTLNKMMIYDSNK